jgi:hypothetical protein
MGLNTVFSGLSPCEEDRILGQTSFSVVYNGSWVGSLSAVNPATMYKMELCSQQSITITGQPVANAPLSLGAGYTWLGYLPQGSLPVNTALAGLTPAPSENDRLLGQNSFAVRYQGEWIGSLATMSPGKGYILNLANASTLQYPSAIVKTSSEPEEEVISPTGEKPMANLRYTMMLIARLKLPDGTVSFNSGDVVFAYSGNECRGMAVPSGQHGGVMFMSVGADVQAGEKVRFKAWLSAFNVLADVKECIVFESLKKEGTMESPINLTIDGYTGSGACDGIFIGEPFPNPFAQSATIPFAVKSTAQVNISLFDSRGIMQVCNDLGSFAPGMHHAEISRGNLPDGIYFYRVVVSGQDAVKQRNGKLILYR